MLSLTVLELHSNPTHGRPFPYVSMNHSKLYSEVKTRFNTSNPSGLPGFILKCGYVSVSPPIFCLVLKSVAFLLSSPVKASALITILRSPPLLLFNRYQSRGFEGGSGQLIGAGLWSGARGAAVVTQSLWVTEKCKQSIQGGEADLRAPRRGLAACHGLDM